MSTTPAPSRVESERDPVLDLLGEPGLDTADPADAAEQARDLLDQVDTDTLPVREEIGWESDPADVLEQRREVGYGDERDHAE